MCPEKIQAEIKSLTREINEHEQEHGQDITYHKLCIKKWKLCIEHARLTEDSWRFKRYFEPDYLRKITRAEISIDYINRWGDVI